MGQLARAQRVDAATFKKALAYGVVISSLCVEDFGVRHLLESSAHDVEGRFRKYRELLTIED